MWTTISAGKVWRGELVNRRKDGSFSDEEMTITPVAAKRGSITHFVAIKQEITERKRAEETLRIAEEKYRAIFEDAVVGIFQATPEGQLLNINRSFATMHGYDSPEQMLADLAGSAPPEFVSTAQLVEWTDALREYGEVRGAEVEVVCRDGARKWLLMNVRAARNTKGEVTLHEGTIEDITERKLAQQQVSFLAYYDALTGLPNRILLRDRLDKALALARRRGNNAALLFLDLDRFKIINDSLGHSFGDLLLKQVATRLMGEIREQDTVARAGGDEFLIVLTSVDSVAEVEAAVARIVKSVAGDYVIQGRSLNINCSLGVSIFPEHGRDGETLIKNADAAMYCAKEKGRNISCFFTDEMNTKVMERLTLESCLRSAIDREELFLVYQPQVNIASGRVTGLEALLRWQHPELGLVMPDKFIQVAESSGLMSSIGEWVLRTVCSQLKIWQDEGVLVVPVAVNVSAVQFRQKGFRELVKQVLLETGIAPQYIELELTESLLLSNADVTFNVLGDLKDMGLKLVIDDFGTGYSSLSYLQLLPVTKIKIDRSFIRDVGFDPDAAAIATAIITMSKSLNLKVIAEGVENEAQLEFLRDHNCDEFQGYYFSRPLVVEDVASKLRKPLMLKAEAKPGTAVA
jgi:diguanylate cyclase (GGDEF)-like protein/PAS domain S-box-containing protein